MRPEFEKGDMIDRHNLLARLSSTLKFLATRFELGCVVVNQVSANIDPSSQIGFETRHRDQKPALGISWRNLVDECVFLSREMSDECPARILGLGS